MPPRPGPPARRDPMVDLYTFEQAGHAAIAAEPDKDEQAP